MAAINAKAVLRKELMEKLDKLATIEIEQQSLVICSKILNHPIFQKAKSVSVYLSMDKEVQTLTIIENIFKLNKDCFIPRFKMGGAEMEMIRLNSMDDFFSLPVNKWNIKQPVPSETRESVFDYGSLDLVLMPGLGFTADGRRLGHGKGYYDKFLAKCANCFAQPPVTMGLALKEQIVDDLPVISTDYRLDYVINAQS